MCSSNNGPDRTAVLLVAHTLGSASSTECKELQTEQRILWLPTDSMANNGTTNVLRASLRMRLHPKHLLASFNYKFNSFSLLLRSLHYQYRTLHFTLPLFDDRLRGAATFRVHPRSSPPMPAATTTREQAPPPLNLVPEVTWRFSSKFTFGTQSIFTGNIPDI